MKTMDLTFCPLIQVIRYKTVDCFSYHEHSTKELIIQIGANVCTLAFPLSVIHNNKS